MIFTTRPLRRQRLGTENRSLWPLWPCCGIMSSVVRRALCASPVEASPANRVALNIGSAPKPSLASFPSVKFLFSVSFVIFCADLFLSRVRV